tara:strand:- start:236 stop:475 length:240 start_codon:yes stop_codon:yes gene_type:complete
MLGRSKARTKPVSGKSGTKKATKKAKVSDPIILAQKALGIPESGQYDWTTTSKLQKFQLLNDLPMTGLADSETLDKLGK